MGTTADKLNYLNETKSLFKDNLNGIGTEITDETTFKEYPDYLENLYNDISEKTDITENGIIGRTEQEVIQGEVGIENTKTEIYINDVDNTKENYITLKGDTEQESTTGKNLLNKELFTSLEKISSSAIIDTGVEFTTTKEASSSIYGRIMATVPLDSSKTYIISCDVTSNNTGRFLFGYLGTSGGTLVANITANTKTSVSYQLSNITSTVVSLGFYLENTTVQVENLMIVEGTTVGDYEPYTGEQPSPNPDYPQEIKNVSGDNEIKITGKNLAVAQNYNRGNVYGVIWSMQGSTITANGTATDATQSMIISYALSSGHTFKLSAGTYTLSGGKTIRIELLKKTGDTTATSLGSSYNNNTFTFTTTEEIEVFYRGSITNGTTVNETVYVQLEKGDQATTYESYISRTFPVNLKSKNLFDKDNANILNAKYSNEVVTTDANERMLYIPCKPNTTYTLYHIATSPMRNSIGTTQTLPEIGVTIEDGVYSSISPKTITTNANAKYIVWQFYALNDTSHTEQQILDTIQIEEGSQATDYEPYYDIELCKIDTYQDYLYKSNGKWYKYNAISKVVLNGSETWNTMGWSSGRNAYSVNINGIKQTTNQSDISLVQTNYFKTYSQTNLVNNNYGVSNRAGNHQIIVRYDEKTTSSDLKQWLSTHNTIVYYVLDTPTSTEITNETLISQLDALYTAQLNNGINNINTITNNLLPYINMKYNVVTPSPSPDRSSEIKNLNGELSYKVTGKNLFDKNNTNILNGYIGSDSIISTSGVRTLYIPCKSNTTYTISKIVSSRFVVATTNVVPTNNVSIIDKVSDYTASYLTISTSLNANYLCVFYYHSNYDTLTEQEILDSIQIEENDHATSYEPYISRTFPINLKSKNLLNVNDIITDGGIINNGDGSITLNGTPTSKSWSLSNPFTLKANTTYTLSNTNYYSSAANSTFILRHGATNIMARLLRDLNSVSITPTEDIVIDTIRIYNEGITFNNFTFSVQLEENDHTTDYMPYTEPYDIQLCKQDTYQDFIKRSTGKNLFSSEMEIGGINNETGNIRGDTDRIRTKDFIEVQPNTVYTLQNDIDYNLLIYEYDENKGFIQYTGQFTNPTTWTTNSNTHYIKVRTGSNFLPPDMKINYQLELGDTATEYEPYGHEFYLHKNIGNVVFDGMEDWKKGSGQRTILLEKTKISNFLSTPAETNILFNYFRISSTTVNVDGKQGQVYIGNTDININYDNGVSSAGEFKTWLSTHNTIMQYVLQTPTIEVISEENYPVLYKQLSDIQDYLTQYKIDKEFILEYDEPSIEY